MFLEELMLNITARAVNALSVDRMEESVTDQNLGYLTIGWYSVIKEHAVLCKK